MNLYVEFWYVRELAKFLNYTEWSNFQKVIDRVILACKNSGFEVSDHFVGVNKMVDLRFIDPLGDEITERFRLPFILIPGDGVVIFRPGQPSPKSRLRRVFFFC